MASGDKIVKNHIKGFENEISKVSESGSSSFFNWFDNSGGDVNTNFLKGHCEFTHFILRPLYRYLGEIKRMSALEIGYGGGRLLAAASTFFKEAVGVDVHSESEIVEKELHRRDIHNFKLIKSDGTGLPIEDNSVNVVYSFIVLQHVEKIEIFNKYLSEAYRILETGGFAVLFFGRLSSFSSKYNLNIVSIIDKIIESTHIKGYKEIPAKVNRTNLKVSQKYAIKKAEEVGFILMESGVSKKMPLLNKDGGQNFIVLRKP